MTNPSNSDPNFDIPFASSNVTLPSYSENPRKKRTRLTNNETGSSSSSSPRPSKQVKITDPDAPEIAPTCTECGKQFGSWKALFGHMRCHPERQWRGINPPPNYRRQTNATAASSSSSLNWVSNVSEKEHEGASCLLMLANGVVSTGSSEVEGRFECAGCKKVFGSHQALGGHRATHKHVKGCFANTNLTEDPPPPPPQEIVDQGKGKSVKLVSGMNHRCYICFRVFSSGQALGGHMRCHWEKDQEENQVGAIDLNVPATTSSETTSGCSLDLRLGL